MTVLCDGMLLGVGDIANLPTFIGQSALAGATNPLVVIPPTTAAGDLMLMFAWWGGAATSMTTPSGWSVVTTDFSASSRMGVFSKIAGSSEGNISVQRNNTSQVTVVVLSYRGGAGLVDAFGTKFNAASDTPVAPSITATHTGVLLASFYNASGGNSIVTPPAGMTQRALNLTGSAAAVYDLKPSPAGATGTKTLVWSISGNSGAILVQIY